MQFAQRITPLTDRDARNMMKNAGVPDSDSTVDLLGRISQLVEELPWLWEMEANVNLPTGKAPVLSSVELVFKR